MMNEEYIGSIILIGLSFISKNDELIEQLSRQNLGYTKNVIMALRLKIQIISRHVCESI